MGCFSYNCKVCGKPINASSGNGDLCEIAFIENGVAKEVMRGYYNNYGCVYKPNSKNSYEWESGDWYDLIDTHFSDDKKNGFLVHCSRCFDYIDYELYNGQLTRSEDDPNQGCSSKTFLKGKKTEIFHKIIK